MTSHSRPFSWCFLVFFHILKMVTTFKIVKSRKTSEASFDKLANIMALNEYKSVKI